MLENLMVYMDLRALGYKPAIAYKKAYLVRGDNGN